MSRMPTGVPNSQPFDLASLPPIDSIGANTDIAAFLRPGVPMELTRAALRRAWTSDPAIRDFVGLVENGWDFNNPDAVSGFGAISAKDVARLASTIIGELPKAASEPLKAETIQCEDRPPLPPPGAADGAGPDVTSEEPSRDIEYAAVQKDTDAKRSQVLEVRNVDGRLHVARKARERPTSGTRRSRPMIHTGQGNPSAMTT